MTVRCYFRDATITQLSIDRFKNNRIPNQVAPDDSLPPALARTKP